MERNSNTNAANFKARQVFGSGESGQVNDEDIITCLKFDPTGQYLCLGDNEGRVIIFKQDSQGPSRSYEYFAEFQSHYRTLDNLNSREISEGIADICWLNPQGKYLKMFTSNSKTIKMWKCFEKSDRTIQKVTGGEICLPKFYKEEPTFSAIEIKTLPHIHEADITSISVSKNGQYLLSSDSQQCLFWSIEKANKPYKAYDIFDKKKVMSPIDITCSKMHPQCDSLFLAGMNKNCLALCDLRQSPTSHAKAIDFGVQIHSTKNFFTEMVSSVGSAQFTKNGKYIISRQYLYVKVWDITQTRKPVLNICLEDGLKSNLVDLYEKNHISDKFDVSGSPDNSTILTGTYNSAFHLMDVATGENHQYKANFQNQTISQQIVRGKGPPIKRLDLRRRVMANCFHPDGKMAAVSLLNCFFIYSL